MSNTKNRPCGNDNCSCSTTIADTLSYGWGELDNYGFWQFPCRTCAAYFEEIDRKRGYTEYMPYWPTK